MSKKYTYYFEVFGLDKNEFGGKEWGGAAFELEVEDDDEMVESGRYENPSKKQLLKLAMLDDKFSPRDVHILTEDEWNKLYNDDYEEK